MPPTVVWLGNWTTLIRTHHFLEIQHPLLPPPLPTNSPLITSPSTKVIENTVSPTILLPNAPQ